MQVLPTGSNCCYHTQLPRRNSYTPWCRSTRLDKSKCLQKLHESYNLLTECKLVSTASWDTSTRLYPRKLHTTPVPGVLLAKNTHQAPPISRNYTQPPDQLHKNCLPSWMDLRWENSQRGDGQFLSAYEVVEGTLFDASDFDTKKIYSLCISFLRTLEAWHCSWHFTYDFKLEQKILRAPEKD